MGKQSILCACYIFLLPALLLAGCDFVQVVEVPSGIQTVTGETEAMGNGQASSWVKMDRNDRPVEVGVTFPAAALEGLPEGPMPTEFTLDLPDDTMTPFDHIGLDWNPQGHEPPGTYDVPHFDVHFYMISPEQRAAVVPGIDTVAVLPEFIPQGYATGGPAFAVPNMGVHYVDLTSHEFHGEAFDQTFIYGFYRGEMTFLEPMVTVDFLQSRPNFTGQIKQPAAFQQRGLYYPTRYTIRYDEQRDQYTISLTGFRQQ